MKKAYTGKSLDELLQAAAKEKNCDVASLTYEVTEEKAGFLGIGKEVSAMVYGEADIEEFLKEYLETYFKGIELEAFVEVINDNGFYRVNLDTQNNAILIGRNGQTLQAVNMVLKAAASSEFKKRVGVLVDINGYKEDKYKKVCSLALRVAKSVQRSKTDALLDPMPADERKAVHSYLTNVRDVTTVSEGEGMRRRLKIVYSPNTTEKK